MRLCSTSCNTTFPSSDAAALLQLLSGKHNVKQEAKPPGLTARTYTTTYNRVCDTWAQVPDCEAHGKWRILFCNRQKKGSVPRFSQVRLLTICACIYLSLCGHTREPRSGHGSEESSEEKRGHARLLCLPGRAPPARPHTTPSAAPPSLSASPRSGSRPCLQGGGGLFLDALRRPRR